MGDDRKPTAFDFYEASRERAGLTSLESVKLYGRAKKFNADQEIALRRMTAGYLYDSSVDALGSLRREAASIWHQYNTDFHSLSASERHDRMSQLFGAFGEGSSVEVGVKCDYGVNTLIGAGVDINFNLIILDTSLVEIGDYTLIAPNVVISPATHPTFGAQRKKKLEFGYPVKIGKNVWIGANAVILPGVSIGDNACIAAGAVVSRDVPASVIAAGVPAKPLRPVDEAPDPAARVLPEDAAKFQ